MSNIIEKLLIRRVLDLILVTIITPAHTQARYTHKHTNVDTKIKINKQVMITFAQLVQLIW